MAREAKTDKILVLGVDGLEPRLCKKLMDEGKLPNIKKYVELGACREDLVMLGAMPTITPPLWTTLATGAYPETHGVTCFWNQSKDSLDEIVYAFDSLTCKAEQLWNVFAENGKKTLVWHWPGASWPPSSDSENLYVVDGV
ncbi:MAG: alkaline phosphatase family protein, partial [Peptococcaceae bacterium]|nr:alkaline phosphatase family protein [Peptococcaceae bacterium]